MKRPFAMLTATAHAVPKRVLTNAEFPALGIDTSDEWIRERTGIRERRFAAREEALSDYSGIVGRLLAKGHARTSGASMIAGYLGDGEGAGEALAKFARLYADQTEADWAALVAAAKAAPELIPNTATATAMASSKLLLAAVKASVAVFG